MINNFLLEEKQGVKFYTIKKFKETGLVKHGFSTRIGGISKKPFDTLNLGFHTSDDKENVKKNRQLFAKSLGIPWEKIVAADQIHGDNIYIVEKKDIGKGALNQNLAIKNTDALITNIPGIPLIAFFADCVPLMFLDPVKRVIAIAHAGWKGTVFKIASKTVQKMKEVFASNYQDILVAICPSIGPCHYEVDKPVIDEFKKAFANWNEFFELKSCGKAQLNLWEANSQQLIELGVPEKNIMVSEICTHCFPNLFYSYRFSSGQTGRMAALIMLTGSEK